MPEQCLSNGKSAQDVVLSEAQQRNLEAGQGREKKDHKAEEMREGKNQSDTRKLAAESWFATTTLTTAVAKSSRKTSSLTPQALSNTRTTSLLTSSKLASSEIYAKSAPTVPGKLIFECAGITYQDLKGFK